MADSPASFVPTVTAISSCPDLQWMVQSVVSSVAPSTGRAHPYSPNTSTSFSRARTQGNKAQSSSRRGRIEQVDALFVVVVVVVVVYYWIQPLCKCLIPYPNVGKLNFSRYLLQLAPEEEEKRRLRRERNKMAAAKCRNRRRELTDTLQAVSIFVIVASRKVTKLPSYLRETT